MERNELTIGSGHYRGDTARLKRGAEIGGQRGDTLTIIDHRTHVEQEYFLPGSDKVLEVRQGLKLISGSSPAVSVSHVGVEMLAEIPSDEGDEGKEILRIRSLFETKSPSATP